MSDTILIIGAGGHGRVVLDIILSENPKASVQFVDANACGQVLGVRVIRPRAAERLGTCGYIIAIGNNLMRHNVYRSMDDSRHLFQTVVHPQASVSPFAKLGLGVVVCAQANIGPGAEVGDGTIVNTGANIDHDCKVGDWCHIAPHATLCGGVTVGHFTLIGAGATVLPGAKIGDCVTIGAQGLVKEGQNITSKGKYVGVPVHEIKQK